MRVSFLLLLAFALAGCLSQPAPSAVPSATPTAVLEVTATPAASAAPLPTATAEPTASATEMPTGVATAVPTGPATINACGRINESGSYLLANDVQYFGTDACISISADNVALDCQSHSLAGNRKGTGIWVSNASNVSIVDCFVVKFFLQIRADDSRAVNITLDTANGTDYGVWFEDTNGSTVARSQVGNFSSGYAINLNRSNGNTFEYDNLGVAEYSIALANSDNNTIRNNSMYGSLSAAVFASNSNGNTFSGNDMSASPLLRSRQQAVLLLKTHGNAFSNNDICSPGSGMFCTGDAVSDLGGNSCVMQQGCSLACQRCPDEYGGNS